MYRNCLRVVCLLGHKSDDLIHSFPFVSGLGGCALLQSFDSTAARCFKHLLVNMFSCKQGFVGR